MQIISAREFRNNQSKILSDVKNGMPVMLTSRLGSFRIIPVSDEDSLTERICRGIQQVKLIRDGKMKDYTIDEALNEI